MIKTVIVNRGVGEQGKTTSIKKVYRVLKQTYPQVIILSEFDDGDIRAIIEIGGVKIGIESQGDPYSRQGGSLRNFVNEGCDIIVVACRTKGDTLNNVYDLEHKHGYRIIFAQHLINASIKDYLNDLYAKEIVQMIDSILNNEF
jgi:hypothetical protein